MNKIKIPKGMETSVFVMEDHALNDVPAVLKEYFPGKKVWVIADENTFRAAGKDVTEKIQKTGISMDEPYIFPAEPRLHPDKKYSEMLAAKFTKDMVPVAVGSGVINDIVKCASGLTGVHYCCVPTACSVDGYTSFGAAMSVDGFKMTIKCPAPYAIVADPVVLKTAPADMMASGYADLLTKVVAGVDWVIVDGLGLEPIDPTVWELVQKDLFDWISNPNDLFKIFKGLAATGYSMQIYRESRPASGAEHMMSHVWEMEGLMKDGQDISHGFKVGVGTIASARLMQFLIDTPNEELKKMAEPVQTKEERLAEIKDLLKRGCYGDTVESLAMEKSLFGAEAETRRKLIYDRLDAIREKMKTRLITEKGLRMLLKNAHCPTEPEEIGLTHEAFIGGILRASLIRKRYTILDVLHELGILKAVVSKLF